MYILYINHDCYCNFTVYTFINTLKLKAYGQYQNYDIDEYFFKSVSRN